MKECIEEIIVKVYGGTTIAKAAEAAYELQKLVNRDVLFEHNGKLYRANLECRLIRNA